MKSERRHEIQENSLARFLEGILEAAKPHATLIGGILLAAVLGWIAYIVMSQEGAVRNEQWHAMFAVVDQSFRVADDDVKREEVAQKFAQISEEHGNSTPALWAEYFFGQQNLTRASDVAFSDPSAATADIERALSSFQKVYDEAKLTALKVKALWGMAEAHELQATPESLKEAKANYEEVLKIWPETTTAELAQQRIERLDNPHITGENGFYAWYRSQDFAARAADAARENRQPLEGGLPGMDINLEAPSGGLFDSPGGAAASGTNPLFTPSMNLDEAAESTPEPSTFTEQEGANPTPSDQPGTPETPATPMAEPTAEAAAPPMPEMEGPAAETPQDETPAAEKPVSEEPSADESASEEPQPVKEDTSDEADSE